MSFDANGSLLLTCDRLGSYFNLFRIVPHPAGSCYSAVHHLYSLYRGDTPGSVQVKICSIILENKSSYNGLTITIIVIYLNLRTLHSVPIRVGWPFQRCVAPLTFSQSPLMEDQLG